MLVIEGEQNFQILYSIALTTDHIVKIIKMNFRGLPQKPDIQILTVYNPDTKSWQSNPEVFYLKKKIKRIII